MAADLFVRLEKLITEHGSAAILKEHVALLRAKMELMEKDAASAAEKIMRLETDNKRLSALAKQADTAEFRSYRGLLWKPEGRGYEPSPYCPRCKMPLGQWPPGAEQTWACTDKCGLVVDWFPAPAA
jgi:hypothetical protein